MRIEHIAIYVSNLEESRRFYEVYFGGSSNEMYQNPKKQFSSYFITFDNGCRLELMHQPQRVLQNDPDGRGIHHFAFTTGSRNNVDDLTNRLRTDGYTIYGEPRTTGDGYYESIVLDPDGNLVEITE